MVGAEIFARLGQRRFHQQRVKPRRDRPRIECLLLLQGQRAVRIARQPVAIWLGALGSGPDQGQRIVEQIAIGLGIAIFAVKCAKRDHRAVDLAPRVANRRIARASGLERGLVGGEHCVEGRITQRLGPPDRALEIILGAVEPLFALPCSLGALPHRRDQPSAKFGQGGQRARQVDLALVGKLALGQQPLGRSGIADDEDRFAILRLARGPFEVLRSRHRLAVLVGAKERSIERIAREIIIVGIAAEGRGRGLGRPHDPDVGIFAIGVKLILAAAVKRHHLAAGGCGVGTGGFLNCRHCRGSRLDRGLAGRRSYRALNLAGDVANRGDHLGLLTRALSFTGARLRGEPLGKDVISGGRQILQARGDAMLVGENQPAA